MKQATYRVEAFIIPVGNQFHDHEEEIVQVKSLRNEDEVKEEHENDDALGSDENRSIETAVFLSSVETESMQNVTNSLLLREAVNENFTKWSKLEGKSLDYTDSLEFSRAKAKKILGGPKAYSSHVFNKISTLVSIDEKNEDSDEKLSDFCHHGCKNGCSVVVPSPQEVSEKIFRDNWLKRLEALKEKESTLRSKEAILQNRERMLFKKEREVRILERHFRDKLKQLEQYFTQNKASEVDLQTIDVQSKSSENFPSENKASQDVCNINNIESTLCYQNVKKKTALAELSNKCSNGMIAQNGKSYNERGSSNKSSSSCSSSSDIAEEKRRQKSTGSRNSVPYKSKKLPKFNYEDLDTTLSADVGDYSFVQTSQKFNPELYRRPFAFTRSASERRAKSVDRNQGNFEAEIRKEEIQYPEIQQGRILKKVTDNISASQDKNTKYQNYGLIDRNMNAPTQKIENSKEEKKFSYLNLETAKKLNSMGDRKETRDRPNSWNAETNEWLQKKRQAYNMTAKTLTTKDFENKENTKYDNKNNKHEKSQKKTDIKSRIFTIFR